MDLGIAYGLLAAFCWGAGDIFARGASRTGGTFRTLLVVQLIAVPALLAAGLAFGLLHPSDVNTSPETLLAAAGIGLVILGGAGLLYHGFAIGNIALVSPIAASYSAITALLAITISGEHPTTPQLAGIVVTLIGVILTSVVPGRPSPEPAQQPRTRRLRLAPGLLEALLSLFIFGAAYWAMRYVVHPLGGYTVVFVQKVGDLVALVLLAIILGLRHLQQRRRKDTAPDAVPAEKSRRSLKRGLLFTTFIVPMAILDTAANIAYTLGITVSLTSIVAVLSSLFSPITVLLAWIFLRERLYRWQWLGVLAIFVGVVSSACETTRAVYFLEGRGTDK